VTRFTASAASTPMIIELCVRWYISYRLSYRDLVELMAVEEINLKLTRPLISK
jgi:hypothetical protein